MSETDYRRIEEFRKEDPRSDRPLENVGRHAERKPSEEDPKKERGKADAATGGVVLELPERLGGRAHLVERDNPEEFLEFHWDPTTYSINKIANWSTGGSTKGTETFGYGGTSAMVLSFDLFLNDVAQPHKTQRSVEGSLEWLFNHLRSWDEKILARKGKRRVTKKWLNIRDPAAAGDPPILVLFGLSHGFECIMTKVSVRTIFQASPAVVTRARFQSGPVSSRAVKTASSPRTTSEQYLKRKTSGAITRATVGIELKEYVKVAAAE